MVLKLDGKAEETSGRRDDSLSSHEPRGLGEFRGCGSSNGLQQSGCTQDGSARQNPPRAHALKRNPTSGKILQRLKLIEAKYSGYVDNHQKQLEAQLQETKSHKLELAQEIAELEQDIYNLISDSSVKE
ncbi:hypothetical protein H6G33_17855 [Calothrix sp. FACHB-1219]|uniref:hypothetical protein n=1 Tax=unclassified Calothrix TaxID=2619626 RepID=UPI001683A56D|nr:MULTISPECIES: hypothetical protein [unclassified Calothrix]MBD2202744.1 hypothetical protein [Calothrix sp. FACHB-168]MBD2218897.1 hypothetical protein [Calothrix sp. FACHB-1219]